MRGVGVRAARRKVEFSICVCHACAVLHDRAAWQVFDSTAMDYLRRVTPNNYYNLSSYLVCLCYVMPGLLKLRLFCAFNANSAPFSVAIDELGHMFL